jgi:hypothetical protein
MRPAGTLLASLALLAVGACGSDDSAGTTTSADPDDAALQALEDAAAAARAGDFEAVCELQLDPGPDCPRVLSRQPDPASLFERVAKETPHSIETETAGQIAIRYPSGQRYFLVEDGGEWKLPVVSVTAE